MYVSTSVRLRSGWKVSCLALYLVGLVCVGLRQHSPPTRSTTTPQPRSQSRPSMPAPIRSASSARPAWSPTWCATSAASTSEITTLMGAGVDPHLYKASPADVGAPQPGRHHLLFRPAPGRKADGAARADAHTEADNRRGRRNSPRASSLADEHGVGRSARLVRRLALERSGRRGRRMRSVSSIRKHAADYARSAPRRISRSWPSCTTKSQDELADDPAGAAACWSPRTTPSATSAGPMTSKSAASRASAPTAKRACSEVNELVDFLVERKIKAVFVETSVADQNIKSLLEGCRPAATTSRSAASSSPTRWAKPARRKERTTAWSAQRETIAKP